jgi:hypothetical protein
METSCSPGIIGVENDSDPKDRCIIGSLKGMGLNPSVITDIDLMPMIVAPIVPEAISAFCLALKIACSISAFLTFSRDLSDTLKSTPLIVLAPADTAESIHSEMFLKLELSIVSIFETVKPVVFMILPDSE